MQRAGLGRRGAAALVDMGLALAMLLGLAAAGFQLTGGQVTTGFSFSTACTSAPAAVGDFDLPRGAARPEGFVPDRVALCRSSVLGATTRLDYVLSRTETHVGLDVTTSHAIPVDAAWRAAGGRVDLDPFLLPLFVLLRWAFDRLAGATPGRWLARIRVAEAESAGARVGAALAGDLDHRYLLFARPCAPILAVGIAEALYGAATGGTTPVFGIAAAAALAVALASGLAAAAAIAEGRSAFYDRPCATLVAGLDALAAADAMEARPPLWRRPLAESLPAYAAALAVVAAFAFAAALPPRPRASAPRPPPPAVAPAAPTASVDGPATPLYAPEDVAAREAQAAEAAARAEAEAERGDPSAVPDLARAIAMEQGVADTDASRAFAFEAERIVGHNLFLAGDLRGAIDEDTRALTLRNGDVGLLKLRAVAELYGGERYDALADLDAALATAPGDAEAALWREVVARRLSRDSRIEADARSQDAAQWPAPIVDLFRGRSTPAALMARVLEYDLSRWAQHRCEAEFFVGEWHLTRGEADPARGALRDALRDCPGGAVEAHAAEDELLGRAGFK